MSSSLLTYKQTVSLILLSVLFITGSVFFLGNTSRQSPSPTATNTINSKETRFAIPIPTPRDILFEAKLFQSPDYSVLYHANWKAATMTFDHGEEVLFMPIEASTDAEAPQLIIERHATTAPLNDPEEQQKLYISLGFTKGKTRLLGKDVTTLSGTTPGTLVRGIFQRIPLQETHIYGITQNGYVYQFVYRYEGSQKDREMEDMFKKMLASFAFN